MRESKLDCRIVAIRDRVPVGMVSGCVIHLIEKNVGPDAFWFGRIELPEAHGGFAEIYRQSETNPGIVIMVQVAGRCGIARPYSFHIDATAEPKLVTLGVVGIMPIEDTGE